MSVSGELESMLSTCAVCRGWAEQDEGPYYRDAQPERRDVVEDREGRAAARHPPRPRRRRASTDAAVEIWQCDALGRYSGFPPPDPRPSSPPAQRPVASTSPSRRSSAAGNAPTPQAWSSSARSTRAGIPAAPCTST